MSEIKEQTISHDLNKISLEIAAVIASCIEEQLYKTIVKYNKSGTGNFIYIAGIHAIKENIDKQWLLNLAFDRVPGELEDMSIDFINDKKIRFYTGEINCYCVPHNGNEINTYDIATKLIEYIIDIKDSMIYYAGSINAAICAYENNNNINLDMYKFTEKNLSSDYIKFAIFEHQMKRFYCPTICIIINGIQIPIMRLMYNTDLLSGRAGDNIRVFASKRIPVIEYEQIEIELNGRNRKIENYHMYDHVDEQYKKLMLYLLELAANTQMLFKKKELENINESNLFNNQIRFDIDEDTYREQFKSLVFARENYDYKFMTHLVNIGKKHLVHSVLFYTGYDYLMINKYFYIKKYFNIEINDVSQFGGFPISTISKNILELYDEKKKYINDNPYPYNDSITLYRASYAVSFDSKSTSNIVIGDVVNAVQIISTKYTPISTEFENYTSKFGSCSIYKILVPAKHYDKIIFVGENLGTTGYESEVLIDPRINLKLVNESYVDIYYEDVFTQKKCYEFVLTDEKAQDYINTFTASHFSVANQLANKKLSEVATENKKEKMVSGYFYDPGLSDFISHYWLDNHYPVQDWYIDKLQKQLQATKMDCNSAYALNYQQIEEETGIIYYREIEQPEEKNETETQDEYYEKFGNNNKSKRYSGGNEVVIKKYNSFWDKARNSPKTYNNFVLWFVLCLDKNSDFSSIVGVNKYLLERSNHLYDVQNSIIFIESKTTRLSDIMSIIRKRFDYISDIQVEYDQLFTDIWYYDIIDAYRIKNLFYNVPLIGFLTNVLGINRSEEPFIEKPVNRQTTAVYGGNSPSCGYYIIGLVIAFIIMVVYNLVNSFISCNSFNTTEYSVSSTLFL